MPILEVEIVGRPEDFAEELAQRVANAAGEVFATAPGRTWIKLRFLSPACYAENHSVNAPMPIFVSILKFRHAEDADRAAEAMRLTAAVAQTCGRAVEHVHLVYQPEGAGRVSFGGTLRVPDS